MNDLLKSRLDLVCYYLEKFGFSKAFRSKVSESVYYSWPPNPLVRIRVSDHPESAKQKCDFTFSVDVRFVQNAASVASRIYSKAKATMGKCHELRNHLVI